MADPERETVFSFRRDMHISYIKSLYADKESFEYLKSAHLRMSAVYWVVTALDLLGALYEISKEETLEFVQKCYNEQDGGYGSAPGHDSHILYTLSAVQILAVFDSLDIVPRDAVAKYIASLHQSGGEFMGDIWGEVDTRFSYCAVSTLYFIGRMDAINLEAARGYINSCRNALDGGYGACVEAESHGGMVFCCVGALTIIDSYTSSIGQAYQKNVEEKDLIKLLGWWLSERQLPCGGFNGRPEKLEDICYSWWVLSSLKMLGCDSWINSEKLVGFILSAQDFEKGGISARPGMRADVFHTLFGICGLSMLKYPGLKEVNPVFCMPQCVMDKIDVSNIRGSNKLS